MRIRVRLFAAARALAKSDHFGVEVASGSNVAELRRALAKAAPALGPLLERSMFAVNSDYAQESQSLGDTDDVALIPPVSGG